MTAHSVANIALVPCAVLLLAACDDVTTPRVRLAATEPVRVEHPVIIPTLPGVPVHTPSIRGPLDSLAAAGFVADGGPALQRLSSARSARKAGFEPRGRSAILTPTEEQPDAPIDSYTPPPTYPTPTPGIDYSQHASIQNADFQLALPAFASSSSSPATVSLTTDYYGNNSFHSVLFTAVPLGGNGTMRTGAIGPFFGPGTPVCGVSFAACTQYALTTEYPISGVGCGYQVYGTSTHRAWMQVGGTAWGFDQRMRYADASGDSCPGLLASGCDGTPDDPYVDDGSGAFASGDGYDRKSPFRPLFYCEGDPTSPASHQVCVTYITGIYHPETGLIEVTDIVTDCWMEQDPVLMQGAPAGLHPLATKTNRLMAADASGPARAAAAGAEVEITLVGTGAIPGGEPTRIVRRRQGPVHDAILVDLGKASEADLASAVAGLLALRSSQGEVPSRDIEGAVSIANLGADWAIRDRSRVHEQLERLRNAPERTLAGIGQGRSITISTVMPAVARQLPK
ncbi:MAG TPA: hypothetical protein VJU87_06570 [Gemmatimonadaceae bacterium]|nr:hypothetical protein [Gemmatimonadaceae bacterium]